MLTFGDELETFFSHEKNIWPSLFFVGNAKLNLYFTTGILDRGFSPKNFAVIVPWRVSKSCESPKKLLSIIS